MPKGLPGVKYGIPVGITRIINWHIIRLFSSYKRIFTPQDLLVFVLFFIQLCTTTVIWTQHNSSSPLRLLPFLWILKTARRLWHCKCSRKSTFKLWNLFAVINQLFLYSKGLYLVFECNSGTYKGSDWKIKRWYWIFR